MMSTAEGYREPTKNLGQHIMVIEVMNSDFDICCLSGVKEWNPDWVDLTRNDASGNQNQRTAEI